ncbi:hypothetical protein B0H19DRAFT_1270283 [Mycena capillaripes]|nr:hypothetical protein B0H19DRAFT_1270283 [Mycena capillaripes]
MVLIECYEYGRHKGARRNYYFGGGRDSTATRQQVAGSSERVLAGEEFPKSDISKPHYGLNAAPRHPAERESPIAVHQSPLTSTPAPRLPAEPRESYITTQRAPLTMTPSAPRPPAGPRESRIVAHRTPPTSLPRTALSRICEPLSSR